MIIAIDFDGTIVTHEYPHIGELVPYARECINALDEAGHDLFLWSMRDDKGRNTYLTDAADFLEDHDIRIHKYNRSPEQFSISPKQFAHLYIDDAALGIPTQVLNGHTVVNWNAVAYILLSAGVLPRDAYENIFGSLD